MNGTPLRRVNQRFVLGTKTTVDISGVKVPEKLNDDYFKRSKVDKKQAKKEGDIFEANKEGYKVNKEYTEIKAGVERATNSGN